MLLKLRMSRTGQKDRATFMKKSTPIQLSSSTTPFNNKKPRYDIPLNKCC